MPISQKQYLRHPNVQVPKESYVCLIFWRPFRNSYVWSGQLWLYFCVLNLWNRGRDGHYTLSRLKNDHNVRISIQNRTCNFCVFSHVQKGISRLMHIGYVLQRLSFDALSDVTVILEMSKSTHENWNYQDWKYYICDAL